MTRKTLLWLVLPLVGFGVLFWQLAFAPNQMKGQPELLEMSVILREGDGAASTMRKGMEQAAADLNVELRFLTPATDNSAAGQTELLEREAAGNVSAIILVPSDRKTIGDAVMAAAEKTTLVTVESGMAAWGALADVTMNHTALGEAIGTAALNGVPCGGVVLLLDSLPGDNGIRERLEAAKALLLREGRQVRVCRWHAGEDTLPDLLNIERPDAVIAFEASALSGAAAVIEGEKTPPLLYGCGSTPEITFSIVRKETMYQSENQKLLFPMT